ncbi:MAG TPA: heparinase II/III family protein, partial [Kofleriaceae bacterium]|nr:heparinase II/III family protein [Kofleriaceae bacterium]
MRLDARWWLARLGAMSLAEVAHRGVRLARAPIDRARRDRLPAHLARWRGPATFVFTPAAARAPLPPALRATAEAYLVGRQVVLGLGERALPDPAWHAAPAAGDPRTTWELNRGHGWVVLARAYAATREPRFRDRLRHELDSWRRCNPVGRGLNWASAMEAAIRCHAFAWIAALLRGDAPDDTRHVLAALLFEHAGFVARNLSRYSSANNHLIVELSGLAVAGRVLAIAPWHRRALAELVREAERQTFADGVNAEMATHYHMFVLEALLLVAWLERAHGAPVHPLERVIARMATYLDAITLGTGEVLHQGDHDDGKILPLFEPRHAAQLLWATSPVP